MDRFDTKQTLWPINVNLAVAVVTVMFGMVKSLASALLLCFSSILSVYACVLKVETYSLMFSSFEMLS